jgi:hypothetical protein
VNIIEEQKKKVEAEVKKLEAMGGGFGKRLLGVRNSAFTRYPLLFVLLSSFGLVATFYGFEKVIDNIAFFAENPYAILLTGIATLIFTGTLFKKLS